MGRRAASLCVTLLKASFSLRVWTTAWAGWGRIHTSPFTSEAARHQTGFSCWVRLEKFGCRKKKGKKSAGVWTRTWEAPICIFLRGCCRIHLLPLAHKWPLLHFYDTSEIILLITDYDSKPHNSNKRQQSGKTTNTRDNIRKATKMNKKSVSRLSHQWAGERRSTARTIRLLTPFTSALI